MPYIPKKEREKLDPLIDKLAQEISANSQESDAVFAGLLNYSVTRLALKVVKLRFGKMRYWIIALLTGVFQNVGDEFYRRTATPYEDKKIKDEGDVDMYEEFGKDY